MSDTESSPRPPAVPSKQQDASRVAAKHSAEHGAAMLPPIHVVKTQKAAIQSEATNKPVTFPGFLPESFGEAGSSLRESHCFESERSLQINGDVLTGSGKNAVCDLPSSTGRGLVTTVDNGFVGLSSLPIVDVETVKVAGFTSLDKKSKPITHTFTPVSDLKGWAKLKRVSMHYVKFFQAFRCLRDVHTPWEIEPSLLKKMDKLGGAETLTIAGLALSITWSRAPLPCRRLLCCLREMRHHRQAWE